MTNEAKILGGIGILTIIIVIGAALMFGGTSGATNSQALSQSQKNILIRPDSHILNPGKKVTLIEFGDFQCPACGAAYPIVQQVLAAENGKVTFVFRNFPLPMHPNAPIAAEAAEAAGAQGKFFDMYNALYENQNSWAGSTNPLSYFDQYAKTIGLNINKFNSDVNSKKYQVQIQQDINDGNALNIQATPTFFINGKMQVGGLPYDQFKALIDADLK